jgi:hypothetical protein
VRPQVTTDTGIRALMPGLDIDDYVFDPCGYSMNGIRDDGFVTIHITPEDGFSYASVEVRAARAPPRLPAAPRKPMHTHDRAPWDLGAATRLQWLLQRAHGAAHARAHRAWAAPCARCSSR